MKNTIFKITLFLIILVALVMFTNKSYAATFENYTKKYNGTYIVPYGKDISFQLSDNESISIENSNIAKIEGNRIQIIGTGRFVVIVKKDSVEEKINFFAWNAYLKKGKYYTYTNVNRKEKSSKVRAKVYFAMSTTENAKTLKIDDCFFSKNSSSEREKIIGNYIKNYYNAKKNKSSSSNWKYSFSSKFTDTPETNTIGNTVTNTISNTVNNTVTNTVQNTTPTNNIPETQPTNGAVAQIGSKYYNSLKEAFDSVPNNGAETEVKLLTDVSLTDYLSISANKKILLNLNTHKIKITNYKRIDNSGILTITNGEISGDKSILNNGELIINSGTISGYMENKGTLTLNDGIITMDKNANPTTILSNEGKVIINNGTLSGYSFWIIFNANSSSEVIMKGGKIEAIRTNNKGVVGICNNGSVTIDGGEIDSGSVGIENSRKSSC